MREHQNKGITKEKKQWNKGVTKQGNNEARKDQRVEH